MIEPVCNVEPQPAEIYGEFLDAGPEVRLYADTGHHRAR